MHSDVQTSQTAADAIGSAFTHGQLSKVGVGLYVWGQCTRLRTFERERTRGLCQFAHTVAVLVQAHHYRTGRS